MGASLFKGLPDTWEIIDRIGATLELSQSEVADMMEVTERKFVQSKALRKAPSLHSMTCLAHRLDIGLELLATGNLDFQLLAKHHFGDKASIPEKYAEAAFGKRRTSLLLLNYVQNHFGWRERVNLLRRFQLNEAAFIDPNLPISYRLNVDLGEYLYRYKMSEQAFSKAGLEVFLGTCPLEVQGELATVRSVGEIYLRMCEELIEQYFEKNFIYRIEKMNEYSCVVSARPRDSLLDAMKGEIGRDLSIAFMRRGIAGAYPMVVGLPAAEVLQTRCISKGDVEFRYEINFEKASRLFNSLHLQGPEVLPKFWN